jgi:Flp pilus assembly pilin Flp
MRKSIALVIAISILGASPPLNEPARATAVEYSVMLALIIVVCITAIQKSDLPSEQKGHLINTVESWKSLPPTKENLAYVKKNTAQIQKLLPTASEPKTQAALRKYTTTANSKPPQPPKSNLTTTRSISNGLQQGKPGLTTTTTAPSALTNPGLLGGAGSAATTSSKTKLPATAH